jgi:hypothetical protein
MLTLLGLEHQANTQRSWHSHIFLETTVLVKPLRLWDRMQKIHPKTPSWTTLITGTSNALAIYRVTSKDVMRQIEVTPQLHLKIRLWREEVRRKGTFQSLKVVMAHA